MRTFADANSQLEQERSTGARMMFRVEFFRQYPNPVKSIDAGAKQFVVDGNATSYFAAGVNVLFPLDDFTTSYPAATVNYSSGSGETTITLTTGSFPTGIVGLEFAVQDVVEGGENDRLLDMSSFRFDTEGETLNQFLAGDVTFELANGDGYFMDENDNGIFDGGDVFWVQVYLGYKNASDRLLYFGGILDVARATNNPDRLSVEVTAYSHEKELERYPAYLISEPFGRFLKLSSVTLLNVFEGERTRAGIKKLSYRFNDESIPGVEVKEIDKDTPAGIRSLKFRFPNSLRYHDGDWTEISEDQNDQTLSDSDGNSITIDTGQYDIKDREIFLFIEDEVSNVELGNKGLPQLQFGDGDALDIGSDFWGVYRWNGGSWSDYTVENEQSSIFTAIQDSNDILYLFTDRPFFGIDLDLSSNLVGTIEVEYSNGFDSWQALSSWTDTTDDLSQSGKITWGKDDAPGWRATTIETTGVPVVNNRFGLRISLTSYTSGFCTFTHISRRLRIYAEDDTALEVKFDLNKIVNEGIDEEIIVRQVNGSWQPCTWYSQIQDSVLLDKILAEANFAAPDKDVDSLDITTASAGINIWGSVPYPFYGKRPTALYYDTANARLWVGIEDELWYHEAGEFKLLGSINSGSIRASIRRLEKNSGGEIEGSGWYDKYDDYDNSAEDPEGPNYNGVVFRCTTSGFNDITATGSKPINHGETCIRKGNETFPVSTSLGVSLVHNAGENIIIPFPQMLKNFSDPTEKVAALIHGGGLLDVGAPVSAVAFHFGNPWTEENHGLRYKAPIGHYKMLGAVGVSGDWLDFKFRLGQPGFWVWSANHQSWVVYRMNRNSDTKVDTNVDIVRFNYGATINQVWNVANSSNQPIAGDIDGTDCYISMMWWTDTGTSASKNTIEKLNTSSGSRSTVWDAIADTATNASQSIWGREDNMTVLDLIYNADEDSIHGCMLDRDNFEYHYFVITLLDGAMYSTQTGNGFTFDKHRQIKNFAYLNNKVYAVVVDTRYETDSAYLIEAEMDGFDISLSKIDTIMEGDYDHQQLISDDSGLWGITGKGVLWQYSTTFSPRTEYANLGSENLRTIVNELAAKSNMIWTMRANRKILFKKRDSYDGSIILHQDIHLASVQPIRPWEHHYDGVEVSWSSATDGGSGKEEYGIFGWERNILPLSGKLIQNRHIARLVAKQYGEFFTQSRKQLALDTIALIQLEQADRFAAYVDTSRYAIDRTIYWNIHSIEFDPETLMMKLKGVS